MTTDYFPGPLENVDNEMIWDLKNECDPTDRDGERDEELVSINARCINNPILYDGGHPTSIVMSEAIGETGSNQWFPIGVVHAVSLSRKARDRDWALIGLGGIEDGLFKPPTMKSSSKLKARYPAINEGFQIRGDGFIRPLITASPARAVLKFGRHFVDIHVLRTSVYEGSYSLSGATTC